MNTSYWLATQTGKNYPPLSVEKHVHTLIVGAGLTGLTTAYYLSSVTPNVLLVEADEIGYGASGRNTGKVTAQHGMIYKKLIHTHGEEVAKAYYTAQCEAIDSIEAIIQEHHIDCDWKRTNTILVSLDETKKSQLQDEFQAYLDLGINAEFIESSAYPFSISSGIRMNHQGSYHPYRYALGLSDCLDARGIQIYEHSPVTSIEKEGSGWCVHVNGYMIHAQNVVSATQTPILDGFQFFYAKTYPSVSHLACAKVKHSIHDLLYSIDDPTQSYHPLSDDLMLCGGYEHECAKETKEGYEAWIQSIQSTWDCPEPRWSWSTQDLVSYDHLPLIGSLSKKAPSFFIACGFSKWGNTNANVAAKIISSMILKQENVYAPMFDPSRSSTILQPKCFQMNLKTGFNFLKSHFPSFEEAQCEQNQGCVINIDAHPYGMYRDEQDEIYIIDLLCPHMGCVCVFNEVEHTWDCPCHGSRFSYDGSIIKGPAQSSLSHYACDEKNHVDPHEMIHKKK